MNRIRRTQKGDLLIEFKLNEKSEALQKRTKSLGEMAEVKVSRNQAFIECEDLNEITTKDEIRQDLWFQLGGQVIQKTDILRLRKTYGSTQTGSINLPLEAIMRKKFTLLRIATKEPIVCSPGK